MPHAREDHRQAVLVARGDGVRVALGAARLNEGDDASRRRRVHVIPEREERIRRQHGPFRTLASLLNGNLNGIDSAHLPRPDAHDSGSIRQNNGITLDVLARSPSEPLGRPFGLGGLPLRHHAPLREVIRTDVAGLNE